MAGWNDSKEDVMPLYKEKLHECNTPPTGFPLGAFWTCRGCGKRWTLAEIAGRVRMWVHRK